MRKAVEPGSDGCEQCVQVAFVEMRSADTLSAESVPGHEEMMLSELEGDRVRRVGWRNERVKGKTIHRYRRVGRKFFRYKIKSAVLETIFFCLQLKIIPDRKIFMAQVDRRIVPA